MHGMHALLIQGMPHFLRSNWYVVRPSGLRVSIFRLGFWQEISYAYMQWPNENGNLTFVQRRTFIFQNKLNVRVRMNIRFRAEYSLFTEYSAILTDT